MNLGFYIMNFISPQRAANNPIHKNETQIPVDTREKKNYDTILRYWRLKTNKDIRIRNT